MKFSVFIFFLFFSAEAAAHHACPPTEVVKFAELYANPHLLPCQNVSAGFSMTPPKGYPADPQVKAMCASSACRALIKDALALKPADCFLSFVDVKLNAYKMANSFEVTCKALMGKGHEDVKYQPIPKANKHDPTPKPTKINEGYSTSKPKNDKGNSTLEASIIVKDDHDCPTRCAGKENAKDADELKPPIHDTVAEIFPMPNTTYKASVPELSPKV